MSKDTYFEQWRFILSSRDDSCEHWERAPLLELETGDSFRKVKSKLTRNLCNTLVCRGRMGLVSYNEDSVVGVRENADIHGMCTAPAGSMEGV